MDRETKARILDAFKRALDGEKPEPISRELTEIERALVARVVECLEPGQGVSRAGQEWT